MAERKKTDLLHDIIPEKEQTPSLGERSIWGRIPMVVSALNTVFEEWHKRRVQRYSFRPTMDGRPRGKQAWCSAVLPHRFRANRQF